MSHIYDTRSVYDVKPFIVGFIIRNGPRDNRRWISDVMLCGAREIIEQCGTTILDNFCVFYFIQIGKIHLLIKI